MKMIVDSSLHSRRRVATAAVLAAAALAGCATAAPLPEAQVRERATQRWQFLIAGNYEDAYNLLAPGVRALESFKSYSSRVGTGATWTAAEVIRVNCNDKQDACAATVRVASRVFQPAFQNQEIATHIEETWIKQDDKWWMFPKN